MEVAKPVKRKSRQSDTDFVASQVGAKLADALPLPENTEEFLNKATRPAKKTRKRKVSE